MDLFYPRSRVKFLGLEALFHIHSILAPLLPVDHSLSAEESSDGPPLLVLRLVSDLVAGAAHEFRATVLISEGLPPIQVKLLDKIRKWKYVFSCMTPPGQKNYCNRTEGK